MKKQPKKNRNIEKDKNDDEKILDKEKQKDENSVENDNDRKNDVKNIEEELKENEEEFKQKVEDLKKEVENLKNLNMRLNAEFANYKKRTQKEKESIFDLARSDLVSPFLEVLDNLERAISLVEKKDKFSEGIDLVVTKFYDVLNKMGVVEIKSLGEVFDPNFHEAIKAVNDENFEKNVVCEVFQKGFMLNDVVIRHALVVVANP